ncbi:hypothetical protein ACSQ67_025969 [Phaseolus vulgaris]
MPLGLRYSSHNSNSCLLNKHLGCNESIHTKHYEFLFGSCSLNLKFSKQIASNRSSSPLTGFAGKLKLLSLRFFQQRTKSQANSDFGGSNLLTARSHSVFSNHLI